MGFMWLVFIGTVYITNKSAFLVGLVALPFLLVSMLVQIQRWHDRNKNGWWVLINFIPYLGGIWAFIELGCLKGTTGPNRYGEDTTLN